jgi:hypothetical protein
MSGALRITGSATTLPHLIGIIEVAQQFLPLVGMCAPPQKNGSLDSGSDHSFDSGKNNGGITPYVKCNARHNLYIIASKDNWYTDTNKLTGGALWHIEK